MFYIKVCRWLDSNHGPLVREVTVLPTELQPRPYSDHKPQQSLIWIDGINITYSNENLPKIKKNYQSSLKILANRYYNSPQKCLNIINFAKCGHTVNIILDTYWSSIVGSVGNSRNSFIVLVPGGKEGLQHSARISQRQFCAEGIDGRLRIGTSSRKCLQNR